MKWAHALVLFVLLGYASQAGQYFYIVNFDEPLNQIGQVPATGLGLNTPSAIRFGNPIVMSSFGHLTNQPLVFTEIWIQQIQFDLNRGAQDYFLDFDFETRNLDPSSYAFYILFDSPFTEHFALHGLGGIMVPNYSFLPAWTDNELHHLHIEWILSSQTWVLQLDDEPSVNGPFNPWFPAGPDLASIRFSLEKWYNYAGDDTNVQVAIDNVRIGTGAPPMAPVLTCAPPLTLECSGEGAVGTINLGLQDLTGNAVQVLWTIDNVPYQTNSIPAGAAQNPTNLVFVNRFTFGDHLVQATASNGQAPPVTCSTTVSVVDTTPPQILAVSATPSSLWPPNHRMVPVTIHVDAHDSCGATVSRIVSVAGNQALVGNRGAETDWQITGDLTLALRAEQGQGARRVYTLLVESVDDAGNTSVGSVTVPVAR